VYCRGYRSRLATGREDADMSNPREPEEAAPALSVTAEQSIVQAPDSQVDTGINSTEAKTDTQETGHETQPTHTDKSPHETHPRSRSSSVESGEASPPRDTSQPAQESAPPLPKEAPPLPAEAPPPTENDGWDFQWSEEAQAYYFYNRLTGATTWDNPRLAPSSGMSSQSQAHLASGAAPPLPAAPSEAPPAGGYNPAIHGDYDPNAWYAQKPSAAEAAAVVAPQGAIFGEDCDFGVSGSFNRFTGAWQAGGDDLQTRHNDENKSRRQLNAYFDVDAVATTHDGRSLKAERSGKKPSKAELKAFKEKRKSRKEEKRRAWLRD